MPDPCIIRFADNDDEHHTHVFRKENGHPEEVITNLSSLKIAVEHQADQPPPGGVTAQFIFLDKLWYALREVSVSDLEEELWSLLYAPAQEVTPDSDSYLRQHTILDSTTMIEEVPFLYEIELGESEWQVRIGHNKNSFDGPVDEVFQLVSWGFSGTLTEALRQFQQ